MATKDQLRVGIRITATNDASTVIDDFAKRANSTMNGIYKAGIGYKGLDIIGNMSNEYAEQQSALVKLRILEMNNLGKVNEDVYGGEVKYLAELSSKYGRSTEDYAKMAILLRQNFLSTGDIIGGVGAETAKLAKTLDNIDPDKVALFAARLKNDLGVLPGEMDKVTNMAYKMVNMGLAKTPDEAIEKLTEYYARAGLGAKILGLHGAQDAESLGMLGFTIMRKGFSGTVVGTSIEKIFQGLRNTERQGKVSAEAAKHGISMKFFDNKGSFLGIDNFNEQLSKLRVLTAQQRESVLREFSTRQGLTVDEVEYLAKYSSEVKEIRQQYDGMANLNDAFNETSQTQKNIADNAERAKKNMEAAFGKTISNDVNRLNKGLESVYHFIQSIAESNPELTGVGTQIAAAGLGLTGIIGSLNFLGGVSGMAMFTSIATRISVAFAPIMAAVAALEILKYSYDNADSIRGEAGKGSVYDKDMEYYDSEIERLKKETGVGALFTSFNTRLNKAGDYMGMEIAGQDIYDAIISDRPWQSQKENTDLFFSAYKHSPKNSEQSSDTSRPSINYAPVINVGDSSIKMDLQDIFRQNNDTLGRAVEDYFRRKANTSYGSK